MVLSASSNLSAEEELMYLKLHKKIKNHQDWIKRKNNGQNDVRNARRRFLARKRKMHKKLKIIYILKQNIFSATAPLDA